MNAIAILVLAALLYFIFVGNISSTPKNPTPQVASPSTPSTPTVSSILNTITGTTNTLVNDIINTANANNLNPAILYGIVSAEQGSTNPNDWNAGAYNPNDPSGAYGLTQVLGTTAESFGVNPNMLLQSPQTALDTTAKYILKYAPTQTNNMSVVAGVYNGGPDIFNEINNGTVNSSVTNAVGTYIENASNGYNYFNSVYGGGG